MPAFARSFARGRGGVVGAVTLALIVIAAVAGPFIVPFDPSAQDIMQRLQPPLTESADGLHVLGTEALGRDILSRLVIGAQVSLIVGLASVAVSLVVGVTFGLIAGWEDRFAGRVLMALTDIQLAIPFLVLALAAAAIVGRSLVNIVVILGLTNWVQYARVVRAEVLTLRTRDYVEAARAQGASSLWIVRRHLLPNVLPTITVISSLLVAKMILFESSLSFLGLGVPSTTPTWGTMIAEGRDYMGNAWWVAAMPGLAIFCTVVAINLVGDRLRDVLDPRLRSVEM